MINVISTRHILLATVETYLQAINSGSSHVHINLQYKVWMEERENGWLTTQQPCPPNTKIKNIFFLQVQHDKAEVHGWYDATGPLKPRHSSLHTRHTRRR